MVSVRTRLGLDGPFVLVFSASTASNLGDGVLVAAVPLLARELSTDPFTVASVSAAATLPWLIFGLFAGVIVDRTSRRRAMVVTDVLRAGALTLFAAVLLTETTLTVVALAVIVFAIGTLETVFDTAAQAIVPSLVATEALEAANGRLFGAQIAANGFIGPPLGALLFATATSAPFAVDGATFALSAMLLRRLPERSDSRTAPPRRDSVLHDIREGLAWLWRNPGVRRLAIGAGVVNLAHSGAMAVAVLLVRDELDASTLAFGATLTGAAVGAILGTQLAAPIVARVGRRRAIILAVGAFAVSLLVVGTARNAAMVAGGLGVFGAAGEVWNVVAVSYRQALVPDRLLGRVMASYRVIAYGAMPVGAALGGLVALHAGVRFTYLAGAAAASLLLISFLRPDPGYDA